MATALFNVLEDARVAAREHAIEPGNDEFTDELHRRAADQQAQLYESTSGEPPWTATPRYQIAQLRMALIQRILIGNLTQAVGPIVVAVLAEAEPKIAAATSSRATDGARQGALDIVDIVIRRWPELTEDLR